MRWSNDLRSGLHPGRENWRALGRCPVEQRPPSHHLLVHGTTAKTAAFIAASEGGADWGVAILHAWTEADQALWAGVLNFWFIGRVFDRVRP